MKNNTLKALGIAIGAAMSVMLASDMEVHAAEVYDAESGKIVEIQATAEEAVFSEAEFNELFRLAKQGIHQLIMAQKKAIKA